jgi:hypothetical protein
VVDRFARSGMPVTVGRWKSNRRSATTSMFVALLVTVSTAACTTGVSQQRQAPSAPTVAGAVPTSTTTTPLTIPPPSSSTTTSPAPLVINQTPAPSRTPQPTISTPPTTTSTVAYCGLPYTMPDLVGMTVAQFDNLMAGNAETTEGSYRAYSLLPPVGTSPPWSIDDVISSESPAAGYCSESMLDSTLQLALP